MQFVNLQVALGGDRGNTVPKYALPVSEIPVLMLIHGEDALFDFELVEAPEDYEDLTPREELQRLQSIYGQVTDRNGEGLLKAVYGGAGARPITELSDLEIPEGAYKAVSRAVPAKAPKAPKAPTKASTPTKGKGKAPVEPVIEEDEGGEGDGEGEGDTSNIME